MRGGEKEMKKTAVVILAMALLMLFAAVAPVMATKPTVVACGFTAATMVDLDDGKFWWTGDNTILHVRGLTKLDGLFMGPTTMIGTAIITTDFDFNTKTGEGNFVRTWEMTFFEPRKYPSGDPAGIPNPYGIGTLDGKEVGKATSYTTSLSPCPYTGKLVATHGTGDFEKAKLSADTFGFLFAPRPGIYIVRISVGGDLAAPTGELTFHG
jgi:hypothetical protein